MSCGFTAGEGVFLGWPLLCGVLGFIVERRTVWALQHWLVGFVSYILLRSGTTLLLVGEGRPWLVAAALSLMVLGQAMFFGWVASPGGLPFLLTPVSILLRSLGFRRPSQPPFSTESDAVWDRGSSHIALVTTATSLLLIVLWLVSK